MRNTILITALAALSLSSCDGFLDKEPESMLTPENYLTTEANLSSYIYGIYTN